MYRVRSAIAVLCVTLCVATQASASLTLIGTVRDFNDSHPDFEGTISGVVTNLVNSTLAASKNPGYIGIGGGTAAAGGIASATSFAQWYTDVSGVNQSAPLSLTLTETAPNSGVYEYLSNSFFPIDGQYLGNQGRGHNYHFTYEIHGQFTYQGGEVFSFAGDDDVWLFIDNQLTVDLGGVHPVASGSVSLDTLSLSAGQSYDFDLFFAERHTTESNFEMQTSIMLQTNSVPEPATFAVWSLLGLVGVGAAVYRRRKR